MPRSLLPGCMPNRARHDRANTAMRGGQWFRQPILWLGALIFAVSLLGCIVTIVLAWRHADVPSEMAGGSVTSAPSGYGTDERAGERDAR